MKATDAPFQAIRQSGERLEKHGAIYPKKLGREQRNIYLKQMDETFHILAASPSLGIVSDYIKPGYRKFPQGSHIIYYREGMEVKIEIIRILHQNMDAELN